MRSARRTRGRAAATRARRRVAGRVVADADVWARSTGTAGAAARAPCASISRPRGAQKAPRAGACARARGLRARRPRRATGRPAGEAARRRRRRGGRTCARVSRDAVVEGSTETVSKPARAARAPSVTSGRRAARPRSGSYPRAGGGRASYLRRHARARPRRVALYTSRGTAAAREERAARGRAELGCSGARARARGGGGRGAAGTRASAAAAGGSRHSPARYREKADEVRFEPKPSGLAPPTRPRNTSTTTVRSIPPPCEGVFKTSIGKFARGPSQLANQMTTVASRGASRRSSWPEAPALGPSRWLASKSARARRCSPRQPRTCRSVTVIIAGRRRPGKTPRRRARRCRVSPSVAFRWPLRRRHSND